MFPTRVQDSRSSLPTNRRDEFHESLARRRPLVGQSCRSAHFLPMNQGLALDPTAAFGAASRTPPEGGRPRPQQRRKPNRTLQHKLAHEVGRAAARRSSGAAGRTQGRCSAHGTPIGFIIGEPVRKEQAASHELIPCSSRRQEAQSPRAQRDQSLLTSAATTSTCRFQQRMLHNPRFMASKQVKGTGGSPGTGTSFGVRPSGGLPLPELHVAACVNRR
jgi:hypothetical protein